LTKPWREQRVEVAGDQRRAALLDMVLANKRDAFFILAGDRQKATAKQVSDDVASVSNSQAHRDLRWRQQ
jgi:hypothetical protein